MFLKLSPNSPAVIPFLINLPVDGETSNSYFTNFYCNFNTKTIAFDNLSCETLLTMFKDGRVCSRFMEEWIDRNTNLTRVSGNKYYDFTDKKDKKYQQKLFTKYGCKFIPSSHQGTGRSFDEESFSKYATSQHFIITGVRDFPLVQFKLVSGKSLKDSYPKGIIEPKQYDSFFL